jgi:hypothetical protein
VNQMEMIVEMPVEMWRRIFEEIRDSNVTAKLPVVFPPQYDKEIIKMTVRQFMYLVENMLICARVDIWNLYKEQRAKLQNPIY